MLSDRLETMPNTNQISKTLSKCITVLSDVKVDGLGLHDPSMILLLFAHTKLADQHPDGSAADTRTQMETHRIKHAQAFVRSMASLDAIDKLHMRDDGVGCLLTI